MLVPKRHIATARGIISSCFFIATPRPGSTCGSADKGRLRAAGAKGPPHRASLISSIFAMQKLKIGGRADFALPGWLIEEFQTTSREQPSWGHLKHFPKVCPGGYF